MRKPGAVNCRECATRARCLLSAVPDRELPSIETHIATRQCARGELLLERGTQPQVIRMLKVGQVAGIARTGSSEVPLAVLGRGTPVGLYQIFDKPVGLGARCVADSTVCDIPVPQLHRLPSWRGALQQRAGELAFVHYTKIVEWAAAMRHTKMLARVAHGLALLQREDEGSYVPMPSTIFWSQLTGSARETVSRTLAQLEALACFTRRGRLVRVDVDACARIYAG